MKRPLSHFLALCSLAGVLGCGAHSKVERRRGAVVETGRAISGATYAWYMRAVVAERHGRLHEARYSYGQALRGDPQSGAAAAGLMRLDCHDGEFELASRLRSVLERADRPALVLAAAAACALARNQPEQAKTHAERALAEEPFLLQANEVAVDAWHRLGEAERASACTRAYRLATGVRLFESRASAEIHRNAEVELSLAHTDIAEGSWTEVDRALIQGDISAARRLSVSRLSVGGLAARALGWGRFAESRELSLLAIRADPDDPDATAVLALLGELPTPERASAVPFTVEAEAPTPIAQLLLALAIRRVASAGVAKQSLLVTAQDLAQSEDVLAQRLFRQLFEPHERLSR